MSNFGVVNNVGKKDSIFESKETLKCAYNSFIQCVKKYCKNEDTLVYISNIYTQDITKYLRWKDLDKLSKLFFIYQYAGEHGYLALTCRFSTEFSKRVIREDHKEDYVRRNLNKSFKQHLGYIPAYSFILEDSNSEKCHLHGVIEGIADIEELKIALKEAFFGKNYRRISVNNFSVKLKPIWDANGWLSYILKQNYSRKILLRFYGSSVLKKMVRDRYAHAREIFE